jgi:hypothetical protein
MALAPLTALVGGALTVVGCAALSSVAEARPYPVRIESEPSGATVYLDSKEGDPLGQTPFSGKLSAGSHTLIVELDGYVSQVQDITIRRNSRVQRIEVRLSKIELAAIEVVPGKQGGRELDVKGARILVDGRDVGNLPDTIKVPAGPHQVEVVKEGYKTYETWVETAEGERVKVVADLIPIGARPASTGEGEEPPRRVAAARDDDRDDPEIPPIESVEREADKPSGRPVPFFAIGAGLELAGRRFRTNDSDVVQGLRPYDAGGVLMVRLAGEVNPLAFIPNKLASGWGLYGAYARATPLDSTARLADDTEVNVPTSWTELDMGVRYRYRFGAGSFVGAQVGYGTHTFTFDFTPQTMELAEEVPDVDYRFFRIGLEGRVAFGRFAGLAWGGTRLVNSIGKLGDRFAKTDILALNAGVGVAATVTDTIEARLVGHYDRYAHDYTPSEGAVDAAETGLDQFFGAVLSAMFVY